MNCKNCNEPLEIDWDECPACGKIMKKYVCQTCGTLLKANWIKCPKCKTPTLKGTDTPSHTSSNTNNSELETPIDLIQSSFMNQNPEFSGYITDIRDGNKYRWVKIGKQLWMAENLRYIPHVSPSNVRGGIWVYGYEGNSVLQAKQSYNYNETLFRSL